MRPQHAAPGADRPAFPRTGRRPLAFTCLLKN